MLLVRVLDSEFVWIGYGGVHLLWANVVGFFTIAVAGLTAKPFDVLGFADLGAKVLSLAELDWLKNKIDGIFPPSAVGSGEIPTRGNAHIVYENAINVSFDSNGCENSAAVIEVPGSVNVDPSNLLAANLDKGKCNIDLALPDILNFGLFPVQLSPDLPLSSVVDNNFESRVADFGLAKLSLELDIQTYVSTHVMGTFRYLC
ncbi:hypothetical protein OROMI_031566 [Orobanche minor]